MVDQPRPRFPRRESQDMTQFEYFAGQALAGLSANPNFSAFLDDGRKVIANMAWALAREMMVYYPDEEYTPVIDS